MADSPHMIDASSYPYESDGSGTNTTVTFNGVQFHASPTMRLYGSFDLAACTYSGLYITKSEYDFGYNLRLYINDTKILEHNINTDGMYMEQRVPSSGSYSGSYSTTDSSETNVFHLRIFCGSAEGGDTCTWHGIGAYNDTKGVTIWKLPGSHPRQAGAPTLSYAANRTTSNSMVLGISCPYSTVGSYEVYYRRRSGNTGSNNTGSYIAAFLVTTASGTAQDTTRINNVNGDPTYYAFPPRRMNQDYNYDYIVKTFWWNASSGNRFYTVFGRTAINNAGSVTGYWCDNKGFDTDSPSLYPLLTKPTKKISLNVVTASTKVTATTIKIEVNVNIYSSSTLYMAVDKNLTKTKGNSQKYMQNAYTISGQDQKVSLAGTASTAESGHGIKKTFSVSGLSVYEYHKFKLLACDGYNYTEISASIRTTFPFVRIYDTTSKTFKRAMPYICDGANWTPYQAYVYNGTKYVGMNPDD